MTQNEQIETTQDFVEFDASFSQDWLQAVKSDAAPPPLLPQTVADIPKCAFRTSKKARPKISRAFKKIGRGGAILLLGVAIGVATDRTLVVRMNVESSRLANTAASNASGETTIAPDFDNDNLTRFESFDGLNVSNDLTNILDSRDSIYSDLDVDCLDNVDGLAAYAQNDAYDLEVHDENSGDATRVENPFLNFGAAPYADLRQDTVEDGANTDAFPTFNDGPTAIADLPNEDARNFPTWADLANPTNVESAPNENAFGAPYGAAPTQSAFAAPQGVYAAQYAPSQSQAPSQSVVESAKPRAQGFEGFQSYVARSTAPADMTATTPQGNNVNANPTTNEPNVYAGNSKFNGWNVENNQEIQTNYGANLKQQDYNNNAVFGAIDYNQSDAAKRSASSNRPHDSNAAEFVAQNMDPNANLQNGETQGASEQNSSSNLPTTSARALRW